MARRLLGLLALLALLVASSASGAGREGGAAEFTFYPQAGILWRDLYPNNFVDLDPGPGVRDYACGTQTYDGHTGIDSEVRSFREMDIGVPVFAALDGRVISVQDGEFDRNYGPTDARFDNHVVVEHGTGRFTIYGHLRKGIKLKRERSSRRRSAARVDGVERELDLAAPPLHLAGRQPDPRAVRGCLQHRPSGWVDQVPIPTRGVCEDLALSAKPMVGKRDLPVRPSRCAPARSFAARRSCISRVEIGAIQSPGEGRSRIRILRPSGVAAAESTTRCGRATAGNCVVRDCRAPFGSEQCTVGARVARRARSRRSASPTSRRASGRRRARNAVRNRLVCGADLAELWRRRRPTEKILVERPRLRRCARRRGFAHSVRSCTTALARRSAEVGVTRSEAALDPTDLSRASP